MPADIPPSTPQSVTVHENILIPLADGRRLAARVWLPVGCGPVPAIFEYLPYRKRGGTDLRDDTTYPLLARAGYAGVRVDISGTGESDGLLDDEYSEDELSNGCEVIAWIAAQDWCDGNVGMMGISWGGFNSLQIAMRRPPALKAVISMCATADRYADDIHYMGGCLLNDNLTWAAQMTATLTPPPDAGLRGADWRETWLNRLAHIPRFAPLWLSHQRRDAYWKHGSLCEDWVAPTAAVLQIGGWSDAYRNTAPEVVANLKAPAAAIMGPWDHKYPHIARVGAPGDFHGEAIRWFDHWLRGRDTGVAALPAYRAYVETFSSSPDLGPRPGYWVSEAEWPPAAPDTLSLGLAPGALRPGAGGGTARLATVQVVGTASGNFCPGMRLENELPGDQAPDDALSLCFDTAPLDEDIEILGQPEIELVLTSSTPMGMVVARLCEVAPDGRSMLVSYRPFNLTHRVSHEHPEPMVPGETVRIRFPVNHCAHRFARGNRIRLALSNSYWPMVWPSPEPTDYQLDLAGSALHLPRRSGPADPGAMAPARAFPTRTVEPVTPATGSTRRWIAEDGRHWLETFDDFGANHDPASGVNAQGTVRQRFAVAPDDPLSASVDLHWCKRHQRGESAIEVEVIHRMRADASTFHIEAGITARENGAVVFDTTWSDAVPRDHL